MVSDFWNETANYMPEITLSFFADLEHVRPSRRIESAVLSPIVNSYGGWVASIAYYVPVEGSGISGDRGSFRSGDYGYRRRHSKLKDELLARFSGVGGTYDVG